ncbi:unnamed protein product [Dibothriocephalus latus]|uniref:Set1/Ash2 histone methyltransferase complex subunit ASH2-like winged-helix domain-containing protein n=1 Tax=Dibothriocephalus latus TaxID=60516 RepID=A0A3P7NVC3_DIBLA|nr:unnamed protein product [Dibothriocephalus latus]
MTAYHFMCKKCNNSDEEVFSKKQANFAIMCQTALANLMCTHGGRVCFSEEHEIFPFLDTNWDVLTFQPRKANDSWHANIHKTLTSNELFNAVDVKSDLFVSLSCQDLGKIGPSYERFRALTSQLKTNFSKLGLPSPGVMPDSSGFASGDGSGLSCGPNASPNVGADGYILVEPDPHASGRQLWDESEHTAGKPIPGYFYRVCHCPKVVLSLNDRAHQLKLHESQLTITGEKGYSMVRATHSVHTGNWYFEATITDQPEGSATRIGWSQMLGK